MSTAIEWCHIPGYVPRTWNPVVGCTSKGTGCDLCYARTLHNMRHKAYKAGKLQQFPQYAVPFSHVQLMPDRLSLPLKTRKPTCWFVNSVSDLFHEEVPVDYIARVFASMYLKRKDIFIILTKRPQRMCAITNHGMFWDLVVKEALAMLPKDEQHLGVMLTEPLPNVWMGASASTQAEVDHVVPEVLNTNAAVRLLSLEPLVEGVSLKKWMPHEYTMLGSGYDEQGNLTHEPCSICGTDHSDQHLIFAESHIDWVIVGGESGSGKQKPRPMHPDWARGVRDECAAAGVAFFFKQWGAWLPSYDAGQRAHDTANYGKTFGERWAANASSMRLPDGQGMVRAGKTANGHLLDGKEHFAWPGFDGNQVTKQIPALVKSLERTQRRLVKPENN